MSETKEDGSQAKKTKTEHKCVYHAYAVYKPKEEVKDFTYEPIALKDNEVELEIEACGVCHSDLHQQQNDWKVGNYPMVVGHEIIGKIVSVGSAVKDLKVGQRVGVGPQTGCCGDCRECKRGEDQLCPKKLKSYNSPTGDSTQPFTYGGFAEFTRVRADWAFPIPDALPSVQAAPLLCAGVTTWTPFVHNKVKKGDRVGVIGIGGLGHIAIQFAVKMGCHVTAISSSADKEADAKKLGAQAYIASSDHKQMEAGRKTFDFLLSTISAEGIKWEPYFDLLVPDGTLCMVGLPNLVSFNPNRLVINRLTFSGSYLASNREVRNMLEFCAKHGVLAQTEEIDMSAKGANEALKKVHDNTARYRVVLVNKKFSGAASKA